MAQDRNVVRSRSAAALAHQCGNGELTNKQKNWYRIRVFGDDRHRGDLPRGETCIGKDIRRAYWFYPKVQSRSGRNAATSHRAKLGHPKTPARWSFFKSRTQTRRCVGGSRVLPFLGRTGRPFRDPKVKTQPLFAAGSTSPDDALKKIPASHGAIPPVFSNSA